MQAAFAERGVPFRPAVEVGNLSLVRRYVAAGLGVAPVPAVAFGARAGEPAVDRCRLARAGRVTYHRATRRGVPFPDPCRRLLRLLL